MRYAIGGKSNKMSCIIRMTIKMTQIAYDMRDIISVAFLDIGYSVDGVSYRLFGNIH